MIIEYVLSIQDTLLVMSVSCKGKLGLVISWLFLYILQSRRPITTFINALSAASRGDTCSCIGRALRRGHVAKRVNGA